MPVNTHIEFNEITDFTPGYTDVGDWLMPGNGSQEMENCYPDPAGGLRASPKAIPFSTTGLPGGAKLAGIFTHSMPDQHGGVSSDRFIAIYDGASHIKIYRYNETVNPSPTGWTLVATYAGVSSGIPVMFDTFVDSTGSTYILWNITQGTVDNGLYSFRFSYQYGAGVSASDDLGNTFTASPVGIIGPSGGEFVTAFTVQDDRVIAANGLKVSELVWSASQDQTSFPAANTLQVQASRDGSNIVTIVPMAPSDLFIGTFSSPWTMVQGGVSDPLVRTMSAEAVPGRSQRTAVTPAGFTFVALLNGIYSTGDGNSFQNLSEQINPYTWRESSSNGAQGPGQVSFGANFLLAPHGLMYDFRTKSWFRVSAIDGDSGNFHSWYDGFLHTFFVGDGGADFGLYTIDGYELTRHNEFTWKSAPMRRPQRNIRIREVQVVCKNYQDGDEITCTVGSSGYTETLNGVGRRQTIRFLFDEWAEMLDVEIVSTSNNTAEAPSIEAVRVGSMDDHQTIAFA